jgi:hypothetical protein
VNCAVIFPAGGGIEGLPYVALVGGWLNVEVVQPLKDWTPDGGIRLAVGCCYEVRLSLGACRGVATSGMGLEVPGVGEEVFSTVASAAGM